MDDFGEMIARLDLRLFRHIESQTTENDRRSLLALQLAFRQQPKPFVYLEIGSHLGGSLQGLVVDPHCCQIVSIDPRPLSQPDERGPTFHYSDNSTSRMLHLLRQIPGGNVDKVHTIDAGTDTISPASLPYRPDLCLVDGEHTDAAMLRDANFCLEVVQSSGCIAFHDAQIVYHGLRQFIQHLTERSLSFRAYTLPDCVFVVEFGSCAISQCPHIQAMLVNNYQAYLWSLLANDEYRQTCRRPLFRLLRKLDAKWRRLVSRRR